MDKTVVEKIAEEDAPSSLGNRVISVARTLVEFFQALCEILIRMLISACLLVLPPLVLSMMLSERKEAAWYLMLTIHGWLFMGVVGFFYLFVLWIVELRKPTLETVEVLARVMGLERGVRIDAAGAPPIYRTRAGNKYHLRGCPSLKKNKIAILWSDITEQNLEPCGFCKPPKSADDSAESARQ